RMIRLHGLVALVLVAVAGCGGSAPEHFDAKAPDVPFMSQLDPAGKGPGYDGTMFCGPAVLAGIAKGHGWTGGLSDADLISTLAEVAGTTERGTTGNGMIAGLDWLGMEHDAVRGCDLEWIDNELAAGHDLIAMGDYWSLPNHYDASKAAGHFIAVTGAL